MIRDRRLIDKGLREPLQALIEQGRYHAELAQVHADALTEHNWIPQQTADIAAEVAAIDTDKSRQIEEREGAKASTRSEGAAISEAKHLINRVRNVARQVVRKNPDAGVTAADFNAGGPLGRVAGRISAFLVRIRVPAGKLDAAFAPFFKNQPISTLIDAAKSRLDTASTTQEVDIATLPEDTAALYERKGRLLDTSRTSTRSPATPSRMRPRPGPSSIRTS